MIVSTPPVNSEAWQSQTAAYIACLVFLGYPDVWHHLCWVSVRPEKNCDAAPLAEALNDSYLGSKLKEVEYLQVCSDDWVVVHQHIRVRGKQCWRLRHVVHHPLLGDLSVHLSRPSAAPRHDAVGQQRRVGVMVGARSGGHAADVTRAGGAASAAGGAAFGRGQVVLDYPSRRSWGCKVSWECCVSWRDWVSVDWDKALVGLGHGHGRPCWNCTHLSRRGNSLGWVEVPRGGGSSGSIAWVAKVADGAGAEWGGLSGGVASSSRGRAGAGVGRQPLPSSQAGVNILEARPTCWSFLPALCHQTIKPKSQQSYFITTNSNNQTASKTLFELNTLNPNTRVQ